MSDQQPTHEPSDDAHGDHGQDAPLGPIDQAAWGAGILGIGVAVAMTLAFMIATSGG